MNEKKHNKAICLGYEMIFRTSQFKIFGLGENSIRSIRDLRCCIPRWSIWRRKKNVKQTERLAFKCIWMYQRTRRQSLEKLYKSSSVVGISYSRTKSLECPLWKSYNQTKYWTYARNIYEFVKYKKKNI